MSINQQKAIRVILGDDHPIVRSGIRNELAEHADIQVVGEAVNGDEALALTETLQPEVLLLDINMPGLRAVEVVRRLRARQPALRVVVLSAYGDNEHVVALLSAGARGYILKDEDPAVIVQALRAVTQGVFWLSPGVARVVEQTMQSPTVETPDKMLTRRELEVLQMMARGCDNQHIAESLCVTEATIKFHVSHIYDKLRVNSRVEAVLYAARQGWVELGAESQGCA